MKHSTEFETEKEGLIIVSNEGGKTIITHEICGLPNYIILSYDEARMLSAAIDFINAKEPLYLNDDTGKLSHSKHEAIADTPSPGGEA